MAGKREATHQGRKEDPNEGFIDENDKPRQATAAQMAARKIKAVKGRRPVSETDDDDDDDAALASSSFSPSCPAPKNAVGPVSFSISRPSAVPVSDSTSSSSQAPVALAGQAEADAVALGGVQQLASLSGVQQDTGVATGACLVEPQGAQAALGMAASTNSGVPQFSQQPVLNFGASAPAQGVFGGGNTANSFPPTNTSSNNMFGSGSFPAFGANASFSQAPVFTPPVPSSGFTFSAGSSNPFASTPASAPASAPAFTPAPAPANGTSSAAFNGSIFGFGTASTTPQQPQSSIWGNTEMKDVSAAPASNPFATTTTGIMGTPGLFAPAPKVVQAVPNLPDVASKSTSHETSTPAPTPTPIPANTTSNQPAPSFNPFATQPQKEAVPTTAPPATAPPQPSSPFSFLSSTSAKDPAPAATPQQTEKKSNPFAKLSVPAPAAPSVSLSPSAPSVSQPSSLFQSPSVSQSPAVSQPSSLFQSPSVSQPPAVSQPSSLFQSPSVSQPMSLFQSPPVSKSTSLFQSPSVSQPPTSQQSAVSQPPPIFFPSATPPATSPTKKTEPQAPASAVPKFTTEGASQQPKEFASQVNTQSSDPAETAARIVELYQKLDVMNTIFKEHVAALPSYGDWTPLLKWHMQQSSEIANQITALKKERAAAKGITSQESGLSTKRNSDDESSTPKKPQAADTATSSGFGFFPQTPKATPAAHDQPQASSNFGSAFKATDVTSSTPAGNPPQTSHSFGSAFKPNVSGASGTAAPAQNNPFGNAAAKKDTPKPDNKVPAFGSPVATTTPQSGFQPTAAPAKTGVNFMSQFAKAAKSVEELAAERKKKAMDEDMDSDDDPEEWSREYDEKEAARLAKEKQESQAFSGFKPSTSAASTSAKSPFAPSSTPFGAKTTPASTFKPSTATPSDKPAAATTPFGSSTSAAPFTFGSASKPSTTTPAASKTTFAPSTTFSGASSLFAAKPSTETSADTSKSIFSSSANAGGAATSSFVFNKPSTDASVGSQKPPFSFSSAAPDASSPSFGSRVASPTPSVFGSLNAAPSPASNPFGHLSSGPSSTGRSESSGEEDNDEEEEAPGKSSEDTLHAGASFTSTKRKQSPSESDSDTLEDSMRRKKKTGSAASTPSLMSRMTNADGSKITDSDMKNRIAGSTTPSFGGVGQSSGSVFKPFDFSNPPNTAPPKTQSFAGDQTYKVGSPVKFGTPGPNATTSTPTFSFLQASPSPAPDSAPKPSLFKGLNTPALGSAASSALSSRATTPVSDTTEQGSTADNDEDDGNKGPQLDLAGLTEEEKAEYDVVFHTEVAIAKKQDAEKQWATVARGPVWILVSKENQRAIVRMRIPSGATPLNYNVIPDLAAKVAGTSGKQIIAAMPDDGRITSLCLAVKARNIAEDFCNAYNQYT